MSRLTFQPFRDWFHHHHPTKKKDDFLKETGLSPSTAQKIWHDEFDFFRSDVLEKICEVYGLSVDQVIAYRHRSNVYAVYFNESGLPHDVKDVTGNWVMLQGMDMDSEAGYQRLLNETKADEIVVASSPEHAAIEALKKRMN